jgi:hypothetical protein
MLKIIVFTMLFGSVAAADFINAKGAHRESVESNERSKQFAHDETWVYAQKTIEDAIAGGFFSVNLNYNNVDFPEVQKNLETWGYKVRVISSELIKVSW